MAIIATKTTVFGGENNVILNPKEAMYYPFGFTDWTKMRFVMMLGYTDLTSPNANMDAFGTQLIPASKERDRLFYGVSTNGTQFPREANQPFVGIKTYGAQTYASFPQTIFDQRQQHGDLTYIGVHHPNGSPEGKLFDPGINQAWSLVSPPNQFNQTSQFAGVPVIYMEIVNKGQANQQMIVRYGQNRGEDNSRAGLRQAMINTDLATLGTFSFNDSGAPYDLPNSFFIYNPIPTIRVRVYGLAAIKEA